MSVIKDALKIDPWVGFFAAAAPGRLTLARALVLEPMKDWRPGSGITDERRELPDSEVGDADPSAAFATPKAASSTSFKKGFLEEARRAICSSGTVSLFFSKKPSISYVTSRA